MSSDKLPQLNSKKLLKILSKLGYLVIKRKSSHLHLRSPGYPPLTIPDHDPIAKGTLRTIIRQIGISKQAFLELIKEN